MTQWLETLLSQLASLRQADPALLCHGAETHRYCLGPKLMPAWLAKLERIYGVELPAEYRQFLQEAGNGGAGPGGGIERFGWIDHPRRVPTSYHAGERREERHESGLVRSWCVTYTPAGAEADPFDETYYSAMQLLAGDRKAALSRPFPFDGDGAPDDVARRRIADMLAARPRADDDNVAADLAGAGTPMFVIDGALPLSHVGCGENQHLVLDGPERGTIWQEGLASGAGVWRVADSFRQWYADWLAAAMDECRRNLTYRRLISVYAGTADETSDLAAAMRQQGIRCETEPGGFGSGAQQTLVLLVDQSRQRDAERIVRRLAAR